MAKAIYNGKVYVERGVFAQALLIEDGRIVTVGTNAQVRAAAPANCAETDAGGRAVVPGFNDSHMHLMNLGFSLTVCSVNGARSISEVVSRARAFLREHPAVREKGLLCYGYNQDYYEDEKRLLNRHDLDRIAEDVPVVVRRVCGHIVAANSCAIACAGITAGTPAPEGGAFELGEDGAPNGVFKETAADALMALFAPPTPGERAEMLRAAMQYAVKVGITSVQSNDAQDEGADEVFCLLRAFEDAGRLPLRYRHQITFNEPGRLRAFCAGEARDPWYAQANRKVALGPLKLFKDGSLGARTALMRADYRDDPGNRGVDVLPDAQFGELYGLASENGMQVVTHAIGDDAIARTVAQYERAMAGRGNELRHGVVHYQITDSALHARMAASGVLAFVQPVFLDYDLHIAQERVGAQLASTSYAFGTLARLGVRVAYGSDAPVEDPNPFRGIYCAVARRDLSGFPADGFYPWECVDVCEAVDSYTAGSAYAEFREGDKGRLKPGYLADLAVLDRDIFTVPVEEIPQTRVLLTMIGGETVYEGQ